MTGKGIGSLQVLQGPNRFFVGVVGRSIHTTPTAFQRKDYYQILGVPRNASAKEVKTAYYKLAKQFHPDQNKDASAKQKFQDVSEAYEVLSDETKRREYDSWGKTSEQMGREGFGTGGFGAGRAGPQWNYQSNIDPEELFRKIFGDFTDPRFGGSPFGQGFANFDFGEEAESAFGRGGQEVMCVYRRSSNIQYSNQRNV